MNKINVPTWSQDNTKIELADLFEAYADCRTNKRNTMNALSFELDYEQELIALWEEINTGTYTPGRSIAFIVNQPVKREIFAADFRDRVVHHLLINKLNPLFERTFIYDSYACRKGRGTHFGIKRIDRFIRQCSENYTEYCYVLRLDIQGFFMAIEPQLSQWMESAIPEGLTVFHFRSSHRRHLRISNLAERVNREIKRRTKIASIFPNAASCERLVTGVLIEISEDWESGKAYLSMDE